MADSLMCLFTDVKAGYIFADNHINTDITLMSTMKKLEIMLDAAVFSHLNEMIISAIKRVIMIIKRDDKHRSGQRSVLSAAMERINEGNFIVIDDFRDYVEHLHEQLVEAELYVPQTFQMH